MGSSMTQELSHKPHQVLLATYFASLSVMCMENVLSRGVGEGKMVACLLVGWWRVGGGNSVADTRTYRGLPEHIPSPHFKKGRVPGWGWRWGGHMALPSHSLSRDSTGIPRDSPPLPFPNTKETPREGVREGIGLACRSLLLCLWQLILVCPLRWPTGLGAG